MEGFAYPPRVVMAVTVCTYISIRSREQDPRNDNNHFAIKDILHFSVHSDAVFCPFICSILQQKVHLKRAYQRNTFFFLKGLINQMYHIHFSFSETRDTLRTCLTQKLYCCRCCCFFFRFSRFSLRTKPVE